MRSARRCGRTGKPVMACRGARRHRAVSPQTIPRTRLAHRCGRGCGRGGGRILGPASRRPCGDREGHSQGFLTFARARARGRNGTNSKDGRRCGSGGRLGSMPRRWASVESRSRSRWIASESVSFHRAGSRNARRTRRSRRAASSTPLSRRNANRSIRGFNGGITKPTRGAARASSTYHAMGSGPVLQHHPRTARARRAAADSRPRARVGPSESATWRSKAHRTRRPTGSARSRGKSMNC